MIINFVYDGGVALEVQLVIKDLLSLFLGGGLELPSLIFSLLINLFLKEFQLLFLIKLFFILNIIRVIISIQFLLLFLAVITFLYILFELFTIELRIFHAYLLKLIIYITRPIILLLKILSQYRLTRLFINMIHTFEIPSSLFPHLFTIFKFKFLHIILILIHHVL